MLKFYGKFMAAVLWKSEENKTEIVDEKKRKSSFNHADHSFTIWRVNVL